MNSTVMASNNDTEQLAFQYAHSQDDRSPQTVAAQVVCLVVAFAGVCLRLKARRLTKVKISIDDHFILLALIMYTAAAIDGFICIGYGAGRHEVTLKHPLRFSKASFAFIVLYRPSVAAVKFSVLFLYRRLFPQTGFRMLLLWYGAFVFVYTIVFMLLDIFHCSPVSRAWSGNISSCLNMDQIWVIGGSLNAVTDIVALSLPLPLLWNLHVTKEKRLQLIGVFLLGGFVCIVSVVRCVELAKVSASVDSSYAYATTIIWSTIEVGIGILCACLPVLQPILKTALSLASKLHARLFDQWNSNHNAKLPFRSSTYQISMPEKDTRSSFAQVETNAIRDPDPYANRMPDADEARITVTTRIELDIDKLP